jgi:hypothetical protein
MKEFLIKGTLGLGLLVLAAAEVQAAQNCAPRDRVLQTLQEKYGETRQGIGMGQQGAVVEVFASAASGSWTITVTMPSGITCLVASGQSYETLAEALPPAGNDT